MGVPSFFAWLVSRFERSIIHRNYPYKGQVDFLFLDFNCAIHPAVKKDPFLKREDMYLAVLQYLKQIVDFVQPTKGIYIAIDGVAPRAKMEQQKGRRYKSVKEANLRRALKQRYGVAVRDEPVDFNMISPGTEFMHDLSHELVKFIEKMRQEGGKWCNLECYLSDSTVPGEGEHKIMDFIRANKDRIHKAGIYGLDSDLIFLTMANCGKETVLVREAQNFERGKKSDEKGKGSTDELLDFRYLSIDNLKERIVRILSPIVSFTELEGVQIFNQFDFKPPAKIKTAHYAGTYQDDQRLVMDYIFICLLLGNDFIPNLPSLRIREGGLTTVIQAYKIVSWSLGKYLVNRDGVSINEDFLYHLFDQLSSVEDDFLLDYNKRRDERVRKYRMCARREQHNPTIEWELNDSEYIEDKYTDLVRMGEEGWRVRYYNENFKIKFRHKADFNRRVRPICHQFLEGMKWTLLYYQGKHNNWSWHYKYGEAPSVVDMMEHLESFNFNNHVLPSDQPVRPFVQLMCILPPESNHLLPPEIATKMSSPDSEFHDLYPVDFKLMKLGKKFLWECHPILPEIDIERVNNFVDKVLYEYYTDDKLVWDLNRLGKCYSWRKTT